MLTVKNFEITKTNKNMLVPWYLITAYAYYILDESLIEDHEFDTMAKELLANYDSVEHRHKHLLTKENLEAGTLLLAEENYLAIVVDVAVTLAKRKDLVK